MVFLLTLVMSDTKTCSLSKLFERREYLLNNLVRRREVEERLRTEGVLSIGFSYCVTSSCSTTV